MPAARPQNGAMNEIVRKVRADFNGLFGNVLCLTHQETALDELGDSVELREGMVITAFDLDADENGNPDNLIATGTVARPPDWLTHTGSRWVLMIDANGVRNESDLT
jgi:hypothetical protein